MRPWAAAAALLGLAPSAAAAPGVVVPTLTLEQQAARADLIVRGSLGAPQGASPQAAGGVPGAGEETGVPWRVYPLSITETLAGDAGRLPQVGGRPALYVWAQAPDLPDWRTGQDAFFLLYTARLDSPLVGYNQGYYPVVGERVAVPSPLGAASGKASTPAQLSVAEFRARLLRARAAGQR